MPKSKAKTKTSQKQAIAICHWAEDGEYSFYQTDCGRAFEVTEGTPRENGMIFCCYCGRELRTIKA